MDSDSPSRFSSRLVQSLSELPLRNDESGLYYCAAVRERGSSCFRLVILAPAGLRPLHAEFGGEASFRVSDDYKSGDPLELREDSDSSERPVVPRWVDHCSILVSKEVSFDSIASNIDTDTAKRRSKVRSNLVAALSTCKKPYVFELKPQTVMARRRAADSQSTRCFVSGNYQLSISQVIEAKASGSAVTFKYGQVSMHENSIVGANARFLFGKLAHTLAKRKSDVSALQVANEQLRQRATEWQSQCASMNAAKEQYESDLLVKCMAIVNAKKQKTRQSQTECERLRKRNERLQQILTANGLDFEAAIADGSEDLAVASDLPLADSSSALQTAVSSNSSVKKGKRKPKRKLPFADVHSDNGTGDERGSASPMHCDSADIAAVSLSLSLSPTLSRSVRSPKVHKKAATGRGSRKRTKSQLDSETEVTLSPLNFEAVSTEKKKRRKDSPGKMGRK